MKRKYIDCVRGIAVFLMVWGHTIQCGNGEMFIESRTYLSNVLFRAIYSFHMPLFAVISGYLLSYSLSLKPLDTVLKQRLRSLTIPIITWGTINYILSIAARENFAFSLQEMKSYITTIIGTLWFLWAILVCTVVTIIVKASGHKNIIHLLIMVAGLFSPDRYNLGYFKFLYPFFVMGYYGEMLIAIFKKYIINNEKKQRIYMIVIVILSAIFMYNFRMEHYIYTTGYSILQKSSVFKQVMYNAYRIVAGVAGSIMVLLATWILVQSNRKSNFKLLTLLGKNSLGIYIFDLYVSDYILKAVLAKQSPNMIRTFVLSLVICGACLLITMLLSKSRKVSALLFGGR